jgi:plastocyanin
MAFHDRTRQLGSRLALSALLAWLTLAATGCGSRSDESAVHQTESSGDSTAMAGGESGHASQTAAPAAGRAASSASSGLVVRLVDKGCVQFDPHWVSVAPGQSVTWVNETKAAVTINVDAGAFAKARFVVQPGGRVTSGPAGSAKDYKVWTEPAACQGPPLGSRGSGPGIAVSTGANR